MRSDTGDVGAGGGVVDGVGVYVEELGGFGRTVGAGGPDGFTFAVAILRGERGAEGAVEGLLPVALTAC
ncbi:MAG: hypothetical protein C4527_22840 [Candidatus Omnitrophota bacterium]|nr:MAG: hypothetical protein C4527_22840 [Candidatus Omnitrophota bacterium]